MQAVTQLVEALPYKVEGRGFDSRWRWSHLNIYRYNSFGRTMALQSTQPLTEMSTRNISWVAKTAGAYGSQFKHPCAHCLGIWEYQPLGTLWA
jgi:hypothetical protein